MDFHFLSILNEARRKSDRRQVKQRTKYEYTGREETTVATASWRRRVEFLMDELHFTKALKDQAMKALNAVAKEKGETYVNHYTSEDFRRVLTQFRNQFRKKDLGVLSVHHARPGVSGVYHMSGGGIPRSGLERDWELRKQDDPNAPETIPGKIPSSKQLRANIAHITTQNLAHSELRHHEHPDVRKLFKAIDPYKPHGEKDMAVVWSADEKPFYVLGKLTRVLGREPGAEDHENEYNVSLPRALDYRNRQLPLNQLDTYDSETKWRTATRTQDMFNLTHPVTGQEIHISGISLDAAVVQLQRMAWKEAKPFYETYQAYKHYRGEAAQIKKRHTIPGGEGMLPMDDENRAAWVKARTIETALGSHLKGMESEFDNIKDPKKLEQHRAKIKNMGTSYTWYLWLLASEAQYGVMTKPRMEMLRGSKRPVGRGSGTKAVGKKHTWAIRPVGYEPVARWDTRAIERSGILGGDIVRFEKELKASKYKLQSHQGIKAVRNLWIPLTGDLQKKWGLDTHPTAISDYLHKAKVHPQAKHIVGDMGGKLHPRRELETQMYTFDAGEPRRRFALIPAVPYLQYFDSPHHGGERLVHGKGFQPSMIHDPDLIATKTLPGGGTAYVKRPGYTYSKETSFARREAIAKSLAAKLLKDREIEKATAAKVIQRVRDRKLLSYPTTQPEVMTIDGKKVKVYRAIKPWASPKKPEGFKPAPHHHTRRKQTHGVLPPSKTFGRDKPEPITTDKGERDDVWNPRTVWHPVDPNDPAVYAPSSWRKPGARPMSTSTVRKQSGRGTRFEIRSLGPAVPNKPLPKPTRPEVIAPQQTAVLTPWSHRNPDGEMVGYWEDIKKRVKRRPTTIDGKKYGIEQVMAEEDDYRKRYLAKAEVFIKQARRKGRIPVDIEGRELHSVRDVQF